MATAAPLKTDPVIASKAHESPVELSTPEPSVVPTSQAIPMGVSLENKETISEPHVVEISDSIPMNTPIEEAKTPTPKHLQGTSIKISGKPGTPSPSRKKDERRSTARTVQLVSIEYAHRGSRNTGFLTDISRGGAFIQTRDQLPPIESVLSISIKVDRFPIRISARVVRQNTSDSLGNPAGFGVEFLPHKDPYRQEEFIRAIETMT